MVKSREGLMQEFLKVLGQAVKKLADKDFEESIKDKWWGKRWWKKFKNFFRNHLTSAFKTFANALIEVGATHSGFISSICKLLKKIVPDASLEDKKKKLADALSELKQKIVVIVDDMDRLEPHEAGEVVRLVRGVADFPNVIYLLCYDKTILLKSLKTAYALDGDKAYLDKIVQMPFSLPMPESFTLREMFWTELEKTFPTAFTPNNDSVEDDKFERLHIAIELRGRWALETPRDIARIMNALRLYAGPILDKIDFADAVWLQLVRLKNPALYKWVEDYVREIAACSRGASLSKGEIERARKRLKQTLITEHGNMAELIDELQYFLPGINYPSKDKTEDFTIVINERDDRNWQSQYVNARRLASPLHYRLYFGLVKPKGAMDDAEFQSFLAISEQNIDEAKKFFESHLGLEKAAGGIRGSPILERLADSTQVIPHQGIKGILCCLADYMDIAAQREGRSDWRGYRSWEHARSIFKKLIDKLNDPERAAAIDAVFRHGNAYSWLCHMLCKRLSAADISLLSVAEYQNAVGLTHKRLINLTQEDLLLSPDLPVVLFFWSKINSSCEDEVKKAVTDLTRSDAGLLKFLDKMRDDFSILHPIRRRNIQPFADFDEMKKRVDALATNGLQHSAFAAEIQKAMTQDESRILSDGDKEWRELVP